MGKIDRTGNSRRLWACSAALLGALGLGGAVIGALQAAQVVTGPEARYDMRAGTTSGLGAMGGGGMNAMAAMMGGRGGVTHDLTLELGSTLAPTGAPKADHFMPAGAKLGLSVPLKTPEPTRTGSSEPGERSFRRPHGRMLIFWGCGEHAPAGQPVVIDFAKLAEGQMPPGLWSSAVPLDRWVGIGMSRTYGNWPNADSHKSLSPDSSLLGAHRVAANYAPEMAFTLTHDFMGPLQVNSTIQPSGSVLMQWSALGDATGYYASLMGGRSTGGKGGPDGQIEDLVWWTSSASREFGGGLSDWLSPATVARLIGAHVVMPPQTTSCTIPAEVRAAAPTFMMTTMIGYGPEERFAYPPRPTDPHMPWHIAWEARIRHRSLTSFMPGMAMPGMATPPDRRDSPRDSPPKQDCQPKKRHGLGGLGGMISGALTGQTPGGDGC